MVEIAFKNNGNAHAAMKDGMSIGAPQDVTYHLNRFKELMRRANDKQNKGKLIQAVYLKVAAAKSAKEIGLKDAQLLAFDSAFQMVFAKGTKIFPMQYEARAYERMAKFCKELEHGDIAVRTAAARAVKVLLDQEDYLEIPRIVGTYGIIEADLKDDARFEQFKRLVKPSSQPDPAIGEMQEIRP